MGGPTFAPIVELLVPPIKTLAAKLWPYFALPPKIYYAVKAKAKHWVIAGHSDTARKKGSSLTNSAAIAP